MRVIKPPAPLDFDCPSVFLAGSIEMGRADDWQSRMTQSFADLDIAILNPRRDAWDDTWRQSIDNPTFREQVEWELDAQRRATVILMHFVPDTKAPITLLELGLFAASGKLVVSCPEGYWRKGNVDIVCARNGIPMVSNLGALADAARAYFGRSAM